MNIPNHVCKVCGTKYYACDYCRQQHNFVPWRDVACSIECYKEYILRVLEARGEIEPVTVEVLTPDVEEEPEIIVEVDNSISIVPEEIAETEYSTKATSSTFYKKNK